MRRKRREVLNALYPVTLDAEVLQPPKLEVALAPLGALQPASRQGVPGKDHSGGHRWTQHMLLALLRKLMDTHTYTFIQSTKA